MWNWIRHLYHIIISTYTNLLLISLKRYVLLIPTDIDDRLGIQFFSHCLGCPTGQPAKVLDDPQEVLAPEVLELWAGNVTLC